MGSGRPGPRAAALAAASVERVLLSSLPEVVPLAVLKQSQPVAEMAVQQGEQVE